MSCPSYCEHHCQLNFKRGKPTVYFHFLFYNMLLKLPHHPQFVKFWAASLFHLCSFERFSKFSINTDIFEYSSNREVIYSQSMLSCVFNSAWDLWSSYHLSCLVDYMLAKKIMWNNLEQCALAIGSTILSTEPMSPANKWCSEPKAEQIMVMMDIIN